MSVEPLNKLPAAVARRLIRRAVELAKGDLRGIGFEHAHDRPLDRGTLQRADDRLLSRALDGAVDAGRGGDPLAGAGTGAEQPRGQRRTA